MALKTIVFVHPFLLHYHYPRLSALHQTCQQTGVFLYNLQLAGTVETYHSLIDQRTGSFCNQCLFPDQDLFKIPIQIMQPALKRALEALKPDVVFPYGYSLRIMRWVKYWAEKNGVAAVVISDSNYSDKRRFWPFELLKSLFISRFEAGFVGGTSSSRYLQHLGLPEERIVAGYDVVDNASIQNRNIRNRRAISDLRRKLELPEKYFLFVGRMVKCKNISGLLRSYANYFRSTRELPWDLVLCGDGPDESEFRYNADGLSTETRKHISFRGLVKQPDLIDFFSGASCLILPSEFESWGLVVNEALVCGLPVLVSQRCGCAMDLVQDNINGWKFDPDNLDELTRLMLHVQRLEPNAREEMGKRGQEIIAEWDLDRFCQGAINSAEIALQHLHSTHRIRTITSST